MDHTVNSLNCIINRSFKNIKYVKNSNGDTVGDQVL